MTLAPTSKALPYAPTTIGLYGDTGAGKSFQAAQLALHIFQFSGGKIDPSGKAVGGLRSRLLLTDHGDPSRVFGDLISMGIVEVVDLREIPHPYLGAARLEAGMIPDVTGMKEGVTQGKWVPAKHDHIGLDILDSGTSYAEKMFRDLSDKAAKGINIGGEGAMNFLDGDESWGKLTVGSSNKAHYNVVQNRMQQLIEKLGSLAVREQIIVLVTFAVDRGEQESQKIPVAGPKLVGGAKTAILPGWMGLCYNIVNDGASQKQTHTLWTAERRENGVKWVANRRIPVGHPNPESIPISFAPADIVKALDAHKAACAAASQALRAKLKIAS